MLSIQEFLQTKHNLWIILYSNHTPTNGCVSTVTKVKSAHLPRFTFPCSQAKKGHLLSRAEYGKIIHSGLVHEKKDNTCVITDTLHS